MLNEEDLITHVQWVLKRKSDKKLAFKDLHGKLNKFQYIASHFYSLFNSQFYYPIFNNNEQKVEDEYFTIGKIAEKYKISVKTITNWEKHGLKIKRPSPRILIISKNDLYDFFEKNR